MFSFYYIGKNIAPKTVGERLRKARINKNLTVTDLAILSDLNFRSISWIEEGKMQPIPPTIKKLAAILDVEISYLGCYEDLPEGTLGEKIKKARFNNGMSQESFAKMLGTSVKTLYNWEKDRRYPSRDYLDKIIPFIGE